MVLSNAVELSILSICPDSGDEFAALSSNSTLYSQGRALNLKVIGIPKFH